MRKPMLLVGNEGHTWDQNFLYSQSGWWREAVMQGARHLDFSDVTLWKTDAMKNLTSLGPMDGERMVALMRAYIRAFFDMLRGEATPLLDSPYSKQWPEVSLGGKNPS
jgi:hypothetical protein